MNLLEQVGLGDSFSAVFIKDKLSFLYSLVKNKTFDKIVFPSYQPGEGELLFHRITTPFAQYRAGLERVGHLEFNSFMQSWYGWPQDEYVVRIARDSVIEPDYGWNVVGKRLNLHSLAISGAPNPFQPAPRVSRVYFNKEVVTLEKVISLRDTGEENYFHFYNDVLAKIFFLKRHGHDVNAYTMLVSHRLWEKKFFQYFLNQSPLLRSLKWHAQKTECVNAREALFCKSPTHDEGLYNDVLGLVPLPAITEQKRVYLKRNSARTRAESIVARRLRVMENEAEIEAVFRDLGFEIMDADELELQDQIALFRNTRWLIALHGAGLTNVMFRAGNPMAVMEIFPPPTEGFIPYHYAMLSQMYHFDYRPMIGKPPRTRLAGGFYVPPQELRENMERMLAL